MTEGTASRLVALYPVSWRARYADEFTQVLHAQRFTLRLFADVVGGAVDAHMHGGTMANMLMKRCASGGTQMSPRDAWWSSAVMIGASLVLGALYVGAKFYLPHDDFVDAFGVMAFPAAMILAMPFSYLKDASRAAQIVVVGGLLLFLAAVSYLTALL